MLCKLAAILPSWKTCHQNPTEGQTLIVSLETPAKGLPCESLAPSPWTGHNGAVWSGRELRWRAARPGAAHKGRIELLSPGTPPPQGWEGLQAATPLARLRARARPRGDTRRRGASSEPGRFKGLTRSLARPDGKLGRSCCGDRPAPRGVRVPECRACSPPADAASLSKVRPAPPAGAGRRHGSCLGGTVLGGPSSRANGFPTLPPGRSRFSLK